MAHKDNEVPSWDGSPNSFERFATDCRWYSFSLKQSERHLAAPRVWHKLSGSAKSVVRNLNPEVYATANGLDKLLDVLRGSPLQRLPVPDTFQRLERWSNLHRRQGESVPQLLVREEELFVELQQSLKRARQGPTASSFKFSQVPPEDPGEDGDAQGDGMEESEDTKEAREEAPAAPSAAASPKAREEPGGGSTSPTSSTRSKTARGTSTVTTGYFEDELRGYRLLKACSLQTSERQQILTLTQNSTKFLAVRQALRTMFDEGWVDHSRRQRPTAWWMDPEHEQYFYEEWPETPWDPEGPGATAYWQSWDAWPDDGDGWAWDHDDDEAYYADDPHAAQDQGVEGQPATEEEKGLLEDEAEAFAIAEEAQKTLQQAREAVQRARQARGYYPLGGKGGKASKGQGSAGEKGYGKGSDPGHPPCTICGTTGHRWFECPQRTRGASQGKGKGYGSGKAKGKSKGKWPKGGKGKSSSAYAADVGFVGSYFFSVVDKEIEEPYYLPVVIVDQEIEEPYYHHETHDAVKDTFVLSCAGSPPGQLRGSQVIIDTGATESACGISTLDNFLEATKCRYSVVRHDRPTFRFGDGRTLQAVSRVDVITAAIGTFSIYVLDHEASQNTPLLLGSRALRALQAVINYGDHTLLFQRRSGEVRLLPITTTPGGHLVVDLAMRSTGLGPVRQYLAEKFGVVGPPEEEVLKQMLAVPGFSEESRRGQSTMIPGTEDDNAPPLLGQALQMMSKASQKDCLKRPRAAGTCRDSVWQGAALSSCRSVWCLPVFTTFPHASGGNHDGSAQISVDVRGLRLKLKALRDRQHERSSASVSRVRSQVDGMAMQGRTPARTDPAEPVRRVEDVLPVCPAAGVPSESPTHRLIPSGGAISYGAGDSHRGASHGDGCLGDDGEDGERSVHGGGRPSSPAGIQRAPSRAHGETDSDDKPPEGDDGARTEPTNTIHRKAIHGGYYQVPGGREVEERGGHSKGASPEGDGEDGQGLKGPDKRREVAPQHVQRGDSPDPARDLTTRTTGPRTTRTPSGGGGPTGPDGDRGGQPGGHPGRRSGEGILGALWDRLTAFKSRVQGRGAVEHDTACKHNEGHVTKDFGEPNAPDPEFDRPHLTRPVTSTVRRALVRGSLLLVGSILHDASALSSEIGVEADVIQYGGPVSLSQSLAQAGYQPVFYKPEEIQKFDGEINRNGNAKIIWTSPPMREHLQRTFSREMASPNQVRNHERALRRERKELGRIGGCLARGIQQGRDVVLEMPARIHSCWQELTYLKDVAAEHGTAIYDFKIHGCAFGMTCGGTPVRKVWRIMTTSEAVRMGLERGCPGHLEHVEDHGGCPDCSDTKWYPQSLEKRMVQAVAWTLQSKHRVRTMADDVEEELLSQRWFERRVQESPEERSYALSRQRLPVEPPTGRRLEEVRQLILRLHRSSGHTSFTAIAKLLSRRGAPDWAVELAKTIECPACIESRRPIPNPPSSTSGPPSLWELVGTDVFEFSFKNEERKIRKLKGCLWVDRASRFCVVSGMKIYDEAWEPSTSDIIRVFLRDWMMMNPAPKWLMADSALYYTSEEMREFCGKSGIGLLIAPPEAHWLMSHEEQLVGRLKSTVERMLKEDPDLSVISMFHHACHAHNSTIQHQSGYSPFQWVRGAVPSDMVPEGADPKKAFSETLKFREQAAIAYRKAQAADQLSKLNNSVSRPPQIFEPGSLVMMWRERRAGGKGGWQGPVRVLMREGSTYWLASGAALIRAKSNQIRKCSRLEETTAITNGAAVYRMPVTLETLMRGFRGKQFEDISGLQPPRAAVEDPAQGEVRVPPRQRRDEDYWEFQGEWLVRVHVKPRVSMLVPSKMKNIPVDEKDLQGERQTLVRSGGNEQIINDDYKTHENPARCLLDRWTGETRYRLVESHPAARAARDRPSENPEAPAEPRDQPESSVTKKRSRVRVRQEPQQAQSEGTTGVRVLDPEAPAERRDQPESSRGPLDNQIEIPGRLVPGTPPPGTPVPGTPTAPQASSSSNVDGPRCSVPGCALPGGHRLPHVDAGGNKFMYDKRSDATIPIEASDAETSVVEDSTDSEMLPDVPRGDVSQGQERVRKRKVPESGDDHMGYVFEMEMADSDWKQLIAKPRQSTVWMSKKLLEKGKEVNWRSLTQAQKELFDEAQAKEIANVLRNAAVRSLLESEHGKLDWKRIMKMRWVLTYKSDGRAKARLVVLGFQAPNLVETQSSSPTLSKLGKMLLLTAVANNKWMLESADVASAFLQAIQDLEGEELYVQAPAELGAAFGGDGADDFTILKLRRAFYGLCHAPRVWFETVAATLKKAGWKQLEYDKCLFVLHDPSTGRLIGIAGCHVDDFILGGDRTSQIFLQAKDNLRKAFEWGRWDEKSFEFAGMNVLQRDDGTIFLDQQTYTDKWMEEIPLSPQRASQLKEKATVKEVSAIRGALGSLAWRANQVSPQFLAEIGLMLSEVPVASVDLIVRINKLIREAKRTADQVLVFHPFEMDWRELAVVTWSDAAQNNRVNRGSTVGMLTCITPRSILDGERVPMNIVAWRSQKAPREVLGSNGSEVQAITMGEDMTYLVRSVWAEIHGFAPIRGRQDEIVRDHTTGVLVMDSRGIYDAMTRNTSALHGLRSSRAGYELTISVKQAVASGTHLRWVAGTEQLADAMTKGKARKILLQLLSERQMWRLVYDPEFTAGRKLTKREHERRIRDVETHFVNLIHDFAVENMFPWAEEEDLIDPDGRLYEKLRSITGAGSESYYHVKHVQ